MSEDRSHLHTSASLLIRLRDSSDGVAWGLFTSIYTPLVYLHLRRCGLQEADAADVAQEVLAQVARSIRSFEYHPDRGRFRDWLGAVVRSKIARFLRGRGGPSDAFPLETDPAMAFGEASSAADPQWVEQFNAHLLQVALDRVRGAFEAQTWQAFEQSWLRGETAPAVAVALGVPTAAVYVAKSRVLKRLRAEILMLAEDVPHLVPLN